jgi:hypothetical protein
MTTSNSSKHCGLDNTGHWGTEMEYNSIEREREGLNTFLTWAFCNIAEA